MVQVSSWICEAYGLDSSGTLHAVGRGAWLDGSKMARMDGKMPFPIAEDGTLDLSVYVQVLEDVTIPAWACPASRRGGAAAWLASIPVLAVLTEEGRIYADESLASDGSGAVSAGGYRDMDLYWDFLLALRNDGRVDIMPGTYPLAPSGERLAEDHKDRCGGKSCAGPVRGWHGVLRGGRCSPCCAGRRVAGCGGYCGRPDTASRSRRMARLSWPENTRGMIADGLSFAALCATMLLRKPRASNRIRRLRRPEFRSGGPGT